MFQITVKKKHIIQKTVALEQKKKPNNKNLKQNPNGFQVLCDPMHCHVCKNLLELCYSNNNDAVLCPKSLFTQ